MGQARDLVMAAFLYTIHPIEHPFKVIASYGLYVWLKYYLSELVCSTAYMVSRKGNTRSRTRNKLQHDDVLKQEILQDGIEVGSLQNVILIHILNYSVNTNHDADHDFRLCSRVGKLAFYSTKYE